MSGALRQFTARRRDDGFDPLSIDWHTAFYADDLTLSDGDPVETWADSSGNGRDATQATASLQPIYRTSVAALNSQPAVVADGSDDFLRTAAFTSESQPNTLVAVASVAQTASAGRALVDGIANGSRHLIYRQSDNLAGFAGTQLDSPDDAGPWLLIVTFNGASGLIEKNGTTVASGSIGIQAITGLTLFASFTGSVPGEATAAFIGLHPGTLTATEKADMLAWSRDKYDTP